MSSSPSSRRLHNFPVTSLVAAATALPWVCAKSFHQPLIATSIDGPNGGSTTAGSSVSADNPNNGWHHSIQSTETKGESVRVLDDIVECLRLPRGGASGDEEGGPSKNGKPAKSKREDDAAMMNGGSSNSTSSSDPKRKSRGKSKGSDSKERVKPSTVVPPIVDEVLKHDDYYAILGLIKQDIAQQSPQKANNKIKKAYRQRALQTHPDKTDGDRRAFDKVAEAHDVLSDDNKRKLYDRFGKKGLDPHGSPGGFSEAGGFSRPEDMFRSFFGGGMGSSQSSRGTNPFMRRNRTLRYQLEVTLEDLYNGATRNILVAPPGKGPRLDHHCKTVEVQIPRGALSGQTVVLSGEMDFDFNETPGDLVFELHQRQHPIFTRENHDLAVLLHIRLSEAITGVRRRIRHLDGTELILESARREGTEGGDPSSFIIKDGDVHVLKGYGMPKDLHGLDFGDLYVQYRVDQPQSKGATSLSTKEREQLGQLLDRLEGVETSSLDHDESEESLNVKQLKKGIASDFGRASGKAEIASDGDGIHDPSSFGGSGSQYFFSSSTSSNPFFGMRQEGMFNEEDVDEDMQCRQM